MARASIGSTSGALRTSSRSGQERIPRSSSGATSRPCWTRRPASSPSTRTARAFGTCRHEPARDQNDFQDLTVSWNGNLVAYQSTDDGLFQIHILDLRTGVDKALPAPPTMAQTRPVFSPDARFVAYTRFETGQRVQLVVAPVDGPGTGRGLGPVVKAGDEAINGYQFTPDGTAVFASYDADKTARLVPIDGSAPVVLATGELALVAYQRLAP